MSLRVIAARPTTVVEHARLKSRTEPVPDQVPQTSADLLAAQVQTLLAAPQPPAAQCLAVARQLYQAQRFIEGERLTAHTARLHPDDRDLWNIRGVFLRVLGRPDEALTAFDQALRIDPQFAGAAINRGNVSLDQGNHTAALDAFTRALELDPQGAMPRTMAARALLGLGRTAEAIQRLGEATALRPDYAEAWRLLASTLHEAGRSDMAHEALSRALAANPDQPSLMEAMAHLLRVSGRRAEAEAFLTGQLQRQPDTPWAHFHLGDLLATADPDRATAHLRRALTLAPAQADYAFALLKALCSDVMRDDGGKLDEALSLARSLAARPNPKPAQIALLRDVFARTCAHEDMARLGTFEALGRGWAGAGLNAALMFHLAQADTLDRAGELVAQHRLWASAVENRAARAPITLAPPHAGGKVRLGFLSSDLRDHPVGRLALPLFDHIDHERFEVFVYSFFRGQADGVQARISRSVTGFRTWPEISARDAAQRIASDQLDMLIELGGPTDMNLPEVLAWRPAPIQASYMGYPHSTGLSAVDHYLCDPFNAPLAPDLLLEAPLLFPKSWIALGSASFASAPPVPVQTPEERRGYLTFGSANNPYKYTRDTLTAWARVVAAVPESRFAVIRPEAGSQALRQNITAAFAAQGVSADRLEWQPTRGHHLAAYGDVDISLDTFPLTGGATTVESLLMGVPVVSLAGEAFFQRLSRSILINGGLADLCVDTPEAFHATAVSLAQDRPRRVALRQTLRSDLQASPLGDTETFARDFYDMIHRVVTAKAGPRTGG
jgi:predicted O-linked N-acetylglucosamine transferase (SPINDLY family)